ACSLGMFPSTESPGGTLNPNAGNIWIAHQSILTKLEANPNYSGRDAALAVNSGTSNLSGFVGAGRVAIGVSGTLFGQNSGTANDMAGITAGTGGFSIASTGETPAAVNVYGRQIGDGSTITGFAFEKATI